MAKDEAETKEELPESRESILKKLAASDRPKAAPKALDKSQVPEVPAWVYFLVPISGALLAFFIQVLSNRPLPIG
jgi:hypothetical protein